MDIIIRPGLYDLLIHHINRAFLMSCFFTCFFLTLLLSCFYQAWNTLKSVNPMSLNIAVRPERSKWYAVCPEYGHVAVIGPAVPGADRLSHFI